MTTTKTIPTPLAFDASKSEAKTKINISPFYGYGKSVWAVYPDGRDWPWSKPPLLGFVSADDEFYAERVAYDVGLVPRNDTFRIRAIKSFPRRPPTSAAPANPTSSGNSE